MMTGVAWHAIIDINSVAAKYKRLFILKGEYKQKNGGGTDYLRKSPCNFHFSQVGF